MLHEPIDLMAVTAQDALILTAARCWRDALNGGRPTMPALHALLGPMGHDMLGPVIDSVMHLCDVHFDRTLCAGCPLDPSADEGLVCRLVAEPALLDGAGSCHSPVVRAALGNALRSLRAMLVMH
jgi:hypothetical protein